MQIVPCVGCILVVDDDADTRIALGEYLREFGCQVAVAIDGVDALECLRRGPRPCLVLLDLNMPRMDGATFVRAARENGTYCGVPIVSMSACSARLSPPDVRWHFEKPFALETLAPHIRSFCMDGTRRE